MFILKSISGYPYDVAASCIYIYQFKDVDLQMIRSCLIALFGLYDCCVLIGLFKFRVSDLGFGIPVCISGFRV